MNEPLKFNEAIVEVDSQGRKPHVLLGNGFSIGAHEEFEYGSLYEQARCAQLPLRAVELFEEYGTTNFEGVLRRLDNGIWLAQHYGLMNTSGFQEMQDDYGRGKKRFGRIYCPNSPSSLHGVQRKQIGISAVFSRKIQNDLYDEL